MGKKSSHRFICNIFSELSKTEQLPSKNETLSSNPSIIKKKGRMTSCVQEVKGETRVERAFAFANPCPAVDQAYSFYILPLAQQSFLL
jgi:hypothetical protein